MEPFLLCGAGDLGVCCSRPEVVGGSGCLVPFSRCDELSLSALLSCSADSDGWGCVRERCVGVSALAVHLRDGLLLGPDLHATLRTHEPLIHLVLDLRKNVLTSCSQADLSSLSPFSPDPQAACRVSDITNPVRTHKSSRERIGHAMRKRECQ